MRIGVADQVKKFWAPGRDKSMWILCAVFIGFLLVALVYIGAMIQAYIAAKNFNEGNGIQVR